MYVHIRTYTPDVYVQVFAENYVYVQVFIREFEIPSINEPMCMCRFQNAIYTLLRYLTFG